MSYIQYREKAFYKKGCVPLTKIIKRKISGKLRCATALTDPRSWSLDPDSRRQYFMDTVNSNVSNSWSFSSEEDWLPPTPEKSPKSKRISSVAKAIKCRLHNRKVKSTEQLAIKEIEPTDSEGNQAASNEKIKKLNLEKEELEKCLREHQSEADDLRSLVKDAQQQLSFLHSVKEENTKLKAELRSDIHKSFTDAQNEINYLNMELIIYKDYKSKHDILRSSNEQLREKYDMINLSLKEMSWNNEQLKNEMESMRVKMDQLERREKEVSMAIVDKEVLRERLQMKEERISCLVEVLEEHELTIQDLVVKLQNVTSSVSAKEGAMLKQMHHLKLSLYEKANRVSELEDRLHTSELLIRELENLRDHFRLSHCALADNMHNYKKQFNTVVSCSKKLLAKVETYRAQVSDKQLQIQKLTLFSQSATSIVKFAQLLNVLRSSEEMMESDQDGAASLIPMMRRIVEQLKGEFIGPTVQLPILEIYDTDTQTEFMGVDKSVQLERLFVEDKVMEASLPTIEYQRSQVKITELNLVIENLEESFHRVDSANRSLEKKIISSIAEKGIKEEQVCQLQWQMRSVKEDLESVKSELERNESLLERSLGEIELERDARESTSEMLVASLDRTTFEYDQYITVLENLLKYKEEKIQHLEDYLCNENQQDESPENEYITLLEKEIIHMSVKYINEKHNVKDANVQIAKLQAALTEKMDHFKMVQEKLLKAENIFEHLNTIENECVSYQGNKPADVEVMPTEVMVVSSSSKILSNSEKLKPHLEEEKGFKEMLLRETVSNEYLSIILQRNAYKKKKLKKTINQLRNNIGKIKNILLKLRKKLKLSESMNRNYSVRLAQLQSCNEGMKRERDSIVDQLSAQKSKIAHLELSLRMKCLKLFHFGDRKRKVENILLKMIKQYEKRCSSLLYINKNSKVVTTEREISIINDENEVAKLKSEMELLTAKNNTLSNVIVDLEERLANILYVPQKDNELKQTISVESQTELSEETSTIENVKKHYENIIEALKKDKAIEKEYKQLKSNLQKMKEMYEKDIVNIRDTYQRQLNNHRGLHKKEIEKLKTFHIEECKGHVSRYEMDRAHLKELEELKAHYERSIKSKEADELEFNREIKELKEEVGNIIIQKQKDDSIFKERIKAQEKKFKKHYKKFKKNCQAEKIELINRHREELENLKNQFDMEKSSVECQTIAEREDNPASVKGHVTKDGNQAQQQYINEIFCNKNIDINYQERIQCFIKEANQMSPREIFNRLGSRGSATLSDGKHLPVSTSFHSLVETAENFKELYESLSFFGKYAVQKKAITEDIKHYLDEEMLATTVSERLNLEMKRADSLRAEKDELRRQVVELQRHLANVESDYNLEKTKYENLKKSFASVTVVRKNSEKLYSCLERLKTKLEKAYQCEKRLSEDLEKEKKANERIQVIIESNRISEKSCVKVEGKDSTSGKNSQEVIEITKDVDEEEVTDNLENEPTNRTDLKVVFIQRCGILHTWKEQFSSQSIERY